MKYFKRWIKKTLNVLNKAWSVSMFCECALVRNEIPITVTSYKEPFVSNNASCILNDFSREISYVTILANMDPNLQTAI